MEDKYTTERESWQRYRKAVREGNEAEAGALAVQWVERFSDKDWDAFQREFADDIHKAMEGLVKGKQQPNIARAVKAILDELGDIGLTNPETNSTYLIAWQMLKTYNRMEKKRTELVTAKRALDKARQEYEFELHRLGTDLGLKGLQPLSGNEADPLYWFIPSSELIEILESQGIKLTLSAIRKYQRFGLLQKPIRKGRKAHYSVLAIQRVLAIEGLKKAGYKLADIKPILNKHLVAGINEAFDIFNEDRNQAETILAGMYLLAGDGFDNLFRRGTIKTKRAEREKNH